MTNVEKLEVKMAEMAEQGIRFNVSNYAGLMGEPIETDPEKIAASYLSMFEGLDDPDNFTLRTFTDKDGKEGYEIKCRGKECDNRFKIYRDDEGYNRLTCPECGHTNAI